jgi:hypothetical protein
MITPMSTDPPPVPARVSTMEGIRGELLRSVSPTAADERLLAELAASAASLVFEVELAAGLLAKALPSALADPRKAVVISRTLHDLASIGSVLVRRVEGTLSTAATLRIQRRLHGGATG